MNDTVHDNAGFAEAVSLADRLGIGLLLEEPPRPLNTVMSELVAHHGHAVFLKPGTVVVPRAETKGLRVRITRVRLSDVTVLAVAPLRRAEPLPPHSLHPFLRLDRQGHIEHVNHAGRELLEYAGVEELEKRFRKALPQAIARGEWGADISLGGHVFSFVMTDVDDTHIHVYGQETSERRFMEASLRRSEARLRALIEAAPDAIVITTNQGRMEYVNPQTERMFGYPQRELLGRSIELIIPAWFSCAHVQDLIHGRTGPHSIPAAGDEPLLARRSDGSRFPIEVSSSSVQQDGSLRFASIVRDVTERERAAGEILRLNEHLEKHVEQLTSLNQELESFSYSVSHDLRGPLRSIDGFSAVLLEDYGEKLDTEAQDYLQRIRAATGRMSDLIDGLLRLSRVNRAELVRDELDLSSLARFIAENLRQTEPARSVEFIIEPDLRVNADRALLTVALENLLGNAWKFTAGREPARIRFGRETHEGRTAYVVSDNGAGFDMRYVGKLFRPFERLHGRDYPGTGIGLATVHRIIQRHGGEMWADSREGEGASFFFTLNSCSELLSTAEKSKKKL